MRFVAAALGLLVQTAIGIEGHVLDPQGRGVPNAAVTLTCGSDSRFAVTDRAGRFTFDAGSRDCSLDVRRSGFDAAFVRLSEQAPGAITVRIAVAAVTAEITVTGDAPNRSPFGFELSEDDFKHLAADTDGLIRLAQARAGVAHRSASIFVDGLPASVLPPLSMIARVAVNSDPFSAEYAHGDVTAIHITTRPPARRLRFYTGGTGANVGGNDVLASGAARPDVLSGNVGVMGPLPRLPLTFALTGTGSTDTRVTPLRAILPAAVDPERGGDVTRTNRHVGAGLELNYAASGSSRARLAYRELHSDAKNGGAGELNLRETGAFTQGWSRDFRVTASRMSKGWTFEFGATAMLSRSDLRANSTALGIAVPGQFVSGGGSLASSSSDRTLWTVKHVVRSGSTRPWSAGLAINSQRQASADTANPFGLIEFDSVDAYLAALDGAPTGTLLRAQNTSASYRSLTVAPFVQKVIWRSNWAELNAGLRGDYQRGFGGVISPRVSFAASWRAYSFGAGAGLFARDIPHGVIWRTERDASLSGAQWLARGVSLIAGPATLEPLERGLTSRLDPEIERPREWMGRLSVERSVGGVVAGIDYSHSRDQHLLGSRRDREADRWIDTFESNRRSVRNVLHSQVRFERRRQHLSLHYEWTHAHDDTDGPWSFAQRPGDLAGEWARSSRWHPHSVTLTGTFTLPGAISLNLSNSWLSGTPYSVTTGTDTSGSGLRNDRGGRARNSEVAPSTNDLSLYAYRRFALPDRLMPGKQRFYVNLGVHGSNLLNNRNYAAIGSVFGTPTFGKPTAGMPGRGLRFSFSFD